jgi:hypothetical protein
MADLKTVNKIPENNLKGRIVILAYGFRGVSPLWQGGWDRAEKLTSW